jgi:ABC-type Fe3+-siderophore transport system permease subunit
VKIFDPNVMVITFFNGLLIVDMLYIVMMLFSDFEHQIAAFIGGILLMFLFDMWWLTRRYKLPE